MSQNLDKRAQELLRKREQLAAEIERGKGRYQAALEQEQSIRQECMDLGMDPDNLSQSLESLRTDYELELKKLEQSIEDVNSKLEHFRET